MIIKDFSTRIMREDRIGIIGPNGSGKTTLIKLLLGELSPDRGRVHRGKKLQVAYYDQQREQLDPEARVMDTISEGSELVTVNGQTRHVAGYLQEFLFSPEQLRSPVSTLSGGERNRLLLARLFLRPANLLVMDEPTNDLDLETLELLEELLLDYYGTILLVSHDRAFLDNVVTSLLVFEGDGRIGEYVGGYTDWLRHSQENFVAQKSESVSRTKPTGAAAKPASPEKRDIKNKKLTFKEHKELTELPGKIELLESDLTRLHAALGDASFYQQPGPEITATLSRVEALKKELEVCYARWEILEAQAGAAPK